jgi:predicted phosphodiesterase
VPKGGSCSVCAAINRDPKVRERFIAEWQAGRGGVSIARTLKDEFGIALPGTRIDGCLNRGKHWGTRDAPLTRPAETEKEQLERIKHLLDSFGVAADDIGRVKAVRLSEWQGLIKNEDGEAEIHDLKGASILLTPAWEDGPRWPVVDRAAQAPVAVKRKTLSAKRKWRTAVVLPDVQIGYRRDIDTAELDAFHDEKAMAAALQVVQAVDPDLVVHLGDFLDFAPFGTYEQEAGFALTVQPALDRAHRFLAEVVAAAPRARQVLMEGNHDRRLQKAIVRNALAAFGIRRADRPDEWPVLSVPYLLRLDELGVEYVGGYPAGIYWINERLACIHGHKVRSAGSTAAAVVDDERVSVIFGHVHRIELQHRTRRTYSGARSSLAASPGCLCRIDGAVPSTKGSTDPLGRPIPTAENWQHGVAVVTYQEGDAPFHLELVPIHDGFVMFRGEVYAA